MSEKAESEEFEGEENDEPTVEEADVDLDQVNKDLDLAKKRAQKSGEPPWRRLERLREEKLTAELTSDFADYDIGDGTRKSGRKRRH
jgi:Tfp pilus assembly protein FimV